MLSLRANPKLPGDWKERHNAATTDTYLHCRSIELHETSIVALLQAWALYADAHRAAYETPIGDDGVLGPHWQEIGLAIRGLLNGDVGPRLDCSTLAGFILDTMAANAVDTEKL